MVFGDTIPSSNAKNLHGRIEILENKKIDITSIPTSVIENKIKNDINNENLSNGAVLTYEGFKKIQDLEMKGCKSKSLLAIATGDSNIAGVQGYKINNKTITIEGTSGFIQLLDKNDNLISPGELGSSNWAERYISILLDYCYINCSTWQMDTQRQGIIINNLPKYYIDKAVNGVFTFKKQDTETEWVNGTVFFTAKVDTQQSWFSLDNFGDVDIGLNARAFGYYNIVLGENSFASGHGNIVYGANSFAMGVDNQVDYCSYADGRGCIARGKYAHAEGRSTIAGTIKTDVAHAEGNSTQALGESSHAEGHTSWALGAYAHASGARTIAFGKVSHTEGVSSYLWPEETNPANLTKEDIINQWNRSQNVTAAIGDYSHAEGQDNLTVGIASHAEGYKTQALGDYTHTEGYRTINYGDYSHVEGQECRIGVDNTAAEKIYHAHAEGKGTVAFQTSQHVQGQYNKIGSKNDAIKYAHIVGWGSGDSDRKNIHTLTTAGDAWFAGKVSAGDAGFTGDVSAKSFTLNGTTITSWPSGDNGSGSSYIEGEGISIDSNTISLEAATADSLGGIKISFSNGILTIST